MICMNKSRDKSFLDLTRFFPVTASSTVSIFTLSVGLGRMAAYITYLFMYMFMYIRHN